MGRYLEHTVLQCVTARYLLFLVESVRATDQAHRADECEPLCSPEEEEFMAAIAQRLTAGQTIADRDVGKLRTLFERAGHSSRPVLGSVRWFGEAIRLLDSVSASLKEFNPHVETA